MSPSPTIPSKIPLPSAFIDARGSILNLLELGSSDAPIRGVSVIRTKAGEYRSNHWHREDGHWLFVLSGKMHYAECPVLDRKPVENVFDVPNYPPFVEIQQGEMVYTGPRIWHKTYFPIDTVLLSLSLRPRDHESHEADLVRAP